MKHKVKWEAKELPFTVSKIMCACMSALCTHGKLVRYDGGFWSMDGAQADYAFGMFSPRPVWYYEYGTIKALLKRGLVKTSKYGSGEYSSGIFMKTGKYPVEVVLSERMRGKAGSGSSKSLKGKGRSMPEGYDPLK